MSKNVEELSREQFHCLRCCCLFCAIQTHRQLLLVLREEHMYTHVFMWLMCEQLLSHWTSLGLMHGSIVSVGFAQWLVEHFAFNSEINMSYLTYEGNSVDSFSCCLWGELCSTSLFVREGHLWLPFVTEFHSTLKYTHLTQNRLFTCLDSCDEGGHEHSAQVSLARWLHYLWTAN